jgi:hypothetical protein
MRRARGPASWAMGGLAVACVVGALAAAGCGGDDSAATETTPAAAQDVVPAELVGTYRRTVAENEPGGVPAGVWDLALGPKGEMFVVPPGETGFFNSPAVVDGDRMEIPADPESGCTAAGAYTVEAKGPRPGGSLTFTEVDDEFCPDRASLLAGGAWEATD